MDYYIVVPAHNEAVFLAGALDAILKQTLLPKKVVLVNDNSTDATETVIDTYTVQNKIFQKVNSTSSNAHLPGGKVVNAFYKGFSVLDANYDFIVKLDADIILPPNYFEQISKIFKANPKVGIAGGFAYEKNAQGEWKYTHPMNKDHVRGAFKSYTKQCFEMIGGLKPAIGWDTVDELLCYYHGFDTFTAPDLHVKHLRPIGKAYNKKAKLLQGKAMYIMRYGFIISCIASLKMALKKRNIQVFFDNIKGYLTAKKQNTSFIVTPDEGNFIRRLRWKGVLNKVI